MVQKRAFDDQASHEASFKLRRQEQFCDQPVLFPRYDFYEDAIAMANSSGEPKDWSLLRVVGKDEMCYGVRKPSLSHKNYSPQTNEDMHLSEDFCMAVPPEYFYPECRSTVPSHSRHSYAWLLRNPPQKVVPIGPDYQADIPAWSLPDYPVIVSESRKTVPSFASANDAKEKLAAICITPVPGLEVSRIDNDHVGAGRSDCGCRDEGSSRCVRQHIAEAREKLRISIGQDAFLERSCHDVGEQVADGWLDKEEECFQEVVFSCPYSTGKNFWNYLSSAFPSRTKAEIVRYYYNVFVLRRRAKQNRCDPLNIDSDDDEWHSSDEEDEDSDVESPEGEVCPVGDNGFEGMNESDGDIVEETSSDEADAAEICPTKLINKDDGAQDDSCTSFESVDTLTEVRFEAADVNPWVDADGQNYITESGDVKFWDAGGLSYLSREVDFLPTVSMIEEVFGDEPWNFNPDSKGLS